MSLGGLRLAEEGMFGDFEAFLRRGRILRVAFLSSQLSHDPAGSTSLLPTRQTDVHPLYQVRRDTGEIGHTGDAGGM